MSSKRLYYFSFFLVVGGECCCFDVIVKETRKAYSGYVSVHREDVYKVREYESGEGDMI